MLPILRSSVVRHLIQLMARRRHQMQRRAGLVAVAMVTAAGLVAGGTATAGPVVRSSVVVEDITIRVPGQDPVQAWFVHPGGQQKKQSAPGVLWLHWLGEINGDRSEYLSEAVTMAGRGVVSG